MTEPSSIAQQNEDIIMTDATAAADKKSCEKDGKKAEA
jgi:hypothetical protein